MFYANIRISELSWVGTGGLACLQDGSPLGASSCEPRGRPPDADTQTACGCEASGLVLFS